MEDVIELVNQSKPGDSVEVTVFRDGKTKHATVTLGKRPASVEEGSSITPPGE